MFQGQIGESLFLSPGKLGLFLLLDLFSTSPSQKLGTPTLLKLFLQIGIEKGYPLRKFGRDKLTITVSISNCKKAVFNHVFCKKS